MFGAGQTTWSILEIMEIREGSMGLANCSVGRVAGRVAGARAFDSTTR